MRFDKRILQTPALFAFAISLLQGSSPVLEEGFTNPPGSAKPKTWMHVMSSNMSQEGLTKDLEAIAEVGIGGIQLFNVTQRIPRGNVHYNTDEHRELIQHAIHEADRLGLTFDIHNCDGWSSSGGPWVTPEDSMKMVVWSSIVWPGGKGKVQLPQPTTREGFYRDIAVLAYPALEGEILDTRAVKRVTASDPDFDPRIATDESWTESSDLQLDGDAAWVQFEYEEPFSARSLMVIHKKRDGLAELAYSQDGETWTSAGKAETVRTGKSEWVNHDRFAPITAKYFRILFPQETAIKEIILSALYPVDNPLGRNTYGDTSDIKLEYMPEPPPEAVISGATIINLTGSLDNDGQLAVDLPSGDWTILRVGYTSTGAFNNPASPEGRGLECDKLDAGAFNRHWEAFVARVIKENPDETGNTFESVIIDSYEAGGQNWTNGLEKIFKKGNGYDLLSYLPVLTGRFVDSAALTDGVLYDFRKVVTDLMVTEYYETFADRCHDHGLKAYIEPYGFGPLNDLDIGQYADVPMGEFWASRDNFRGLQSARSSANIYGKPILAAESFTSFPEINWKGHPGMIKTKGDIAMTFGVNRFIFHRYVHQANTHTEPGMTMNTWGFHFDRTQTWWDSAGAAFFQYLARCSFLLQSGAAVVDLLLYEGDGTPNEPLYKDSMEPLLPAGYTMDNLNRDVLHNRLKIQDGRLVLPEGTAYSAIILRPGIKIGLETLLRLKEISENGIPIIGQRPERIPGHGHSEADRNLYGITAEALWERENVYPYGEFESALNQSGLIPDLQVEGRPELNYIHRNVDGTDIYFIYNPDAETRTLTCQFRLSGKFPQQWNPMDGSRYRLDRYKEMKGVTELDIELEANGSAFVIFSDVPDLTLPQAPSELPKLELVQAIPLDSDWLVGFQEDAKGISFPGLMDWKDHPSEAIRHFSGTAVYNRVLHVPENVLENSGQVVLDLGRVEICARVIINGHDLGVLWKAPYTVDITEAVRPGENHLSIEVTNLWTNRLIGDERFPNTSGFTYPGNDALDMPEWHVRNQAMPESRRSTFTTAKFYDADDPLISSGLLGPVRIQVFKR